MVVIIEEDKSDLQQCLKRIDEELIEKEYVGRVIAVVVHTDNASTLELHIEDYNLTLVEDYVTIHFEDKPCKWPLTLKYRQAVNKIRDLTNKKTVLVYDAERGETTSCFINDLQKHLPKFKLKDFHKASDAEKTFLKVIAILRHISIRVEDDFGPLWNQLDKGVYIS
ncbi:uncharacterized protein LOC132717264 [Ruditapes philippinarum]|uniref:uncharacterized protein LOC132717264 n=1 Tax=Ruditapes philippinarum TaxID=129788 RepID=UPI00295A8D33|nr:uncharacterized protein LOC132717264 [Ruditapes philippinarum]